MRHGVPGSAGPARRGAFPEHRTWPGPHSPSGAAAASWQGPRRPDCSGTSWCCSRPRPGPARRPRPGPGRRQRGAPPRQASGAPGWGSAPASARRSPSGRPAGGRGVAGRRPAAGAARAQLALQVVAVVPLAAPSPRRRDSPRGARGPAVQVAPGCGFAAATSMGTTPAALSRRFACPYTLGMAPPARTSSRRWSRQRSRERPAQAARGAPLGCSWGAMDSAPSARHPGRPIPARRRRWRPPVVPTGGRVLRRRLLALYGTSATASQPRLCP